MFSSSNDSTPPRRASGLTPLIGLIALSGISAISLVPRTAQAIQPPDPMRAPQARAPGDLELRPGAVVSPRAAATGDWVAPPPTSPRGRALARLQGELGGDAWARFDRDTHVLDTLIPNGFVVADASRSAKAAEDFSRDFLGRHLALLAPGAALADFVQVSDVVAGGVRSVGFVQMHAGKPVLGGQISLAFKADRLVAVRSLALPAIHLASRSADVDPARAISQARGWIADDFAQGRLAGAHADAATITGPMILPLVHDGGAVSYREVLAVDVRLDQPIGHWLVYVDAGTGEPLARRSLLHWAELDFDVWQRSPLGNRTQLPAKHLHLDAGGQPQVTDAQGMFTVPGPGTAVDIGLEGNFLRVFNDAGPVAATTQNFGPGTVFTWDLSDDETTDAQLNAYVHTQLVKDRVLIIDPEFDVPLSQTTVTVNIADICNAFADQDTINFFSSGGGCENSALIGDVVYHEYGHVVHTLGLIPGVGLFDGAVSEGVSDYLSSTIVNDAKVGKGFFFDQEPIRDLDPQGFEWHWPEDKGEVHDEGRIIGGTLWDLRKLMIAKHGQAEGVRRTDHIWLDSIRRATDMPSMYVEALIANDDDGNLQNGTPDVCEINQAFGAHGLYSPPEGLTSLVHNELPDGSLELLLDVGDAFGDCGDVSIDPTLRWRLRTQPPAQPTSVAMTVNGPNQFRAVIPPQIDFTVVQYQVLIDWGNGTVDARPANPADPWYEYFTGEVDEIWCSDFENGDPGGWALGQFWEVGAPAGGGGDPAQAWSGSGVAGIVLGTLGTYPTWTETQMSSPTLDVAAWERVRLQYRRWLTIEDGFWDQATIRANGQPAWENAASFDEFNSSNHHRDHEWRFHDVELTPFIGGDGTVQLAFQHSSDGGLEFGGWTVDQVCVVGHGQGTEPPDPPDPPDPPNPGNHCGDGIVGVHEQCDDGNLENGDGCSAGCLWESEPETDTGDTGDTGGEAQWQPGSRGCGCTSGDDPSRDGGGLAGLGLLALLGLRRRRRRP